MRESGRFSLALCCSNRMYRLNVQEGKRLAEVKAPARTRRVYIGTLCLYSVLCAHCLAARASSLREKGISYAAAVQREEERF